MRASNLLVVALFALAFACSETHAPVTDGDTPAPNGDAEETDDTPPDGEDGDMSQDGDDTVDGDRELDDESPEEDGDGDTDTEQDDEWVFDRSRYPVVKGWMLLDSNPDAVRETIETAAHYGVNHIQLSHDLIMNIDDVLGERPRVNVETLNLGIRLAHENGMKAYVWVHEFSPTTVVVCYAPDDPIWEARANAYREALALMPDLDGIILMFGSAPTPPWYTLCSCEWCVENYDSTPFESPPNPERIRMVTEKIGGVIVNELGLELFVRTFVHEPVELGFHAEGLSGVRDLNFTGMHKGPVQDWQPFNPHDANIGDIGPRPAIVELDVAGEYWGRSILPMAAPGYFRYRFLYAYENQGIGSVIRVQRGSNHALGTPNEINILTLNMLSDDPTTPLDAIWSRFIGTHYGLEPESPGYDTLRRVLDDTFHVRVKSHYLLGIWAFEKSSSFPRKARYDQFTDRGDMPKWNPAWRERWDSLNTPDMAVAAWTWQEGSEAIELARDSLDAVATLQEHLAPELFSDLSRRISHQFHAARAWRAMKTWIVARRVYTRTPDTNIAETMRAMLNELEQIRGDMQEAELDSVSLAGPGEITEFLSNASPLTPEADARIMPHSPISAVRIMDIGPSSLELTFRVRQAGRVYLDFGTEIPTYGHTLDLGTREAEEAIRATIPSFEATTRLVFRVRLVTGTDAYTGGDWWAFPPYEPDGE